MDCASAERPYPPEAGSDPEPVANTCRRPSLITPWRSGGLRACMFKVGEKSMSITGTGTEAEATSLTPEETMTKHSITEEMLFCGIDVSAKSLTVAIQQKDRQAEQLTVPNSANGHKTLIA